jgi:hypothetical protein
VRIKKDQAEVSQNKNLYYTCKIKGSPVETGELNDCLLYEKLIFFLSPVNPAFPSGV